MTGPSPNSALILSNQPGPSHLRAEEVRKVVRDAQRLGGRQPWVVSADMMKLLLPIRGGAGNDFTTKSMASGD